MEKGLYCYKYPHPAVTVDCVVLSREELVTKILLIKRGRDPYKDCWAFPGGFINPDETAEEAAKRELKEETGLTVEEVKQFHTYTDPHRDPRARVITIAFLALSKVEKVRGDDDASEAAWFELDKLPPLAFDHRQILSDALLFHQKENFLP